MRAFAAVLGVSVACAAFACARSGLELGALEDSAPNGRDPLDAGLHDASDDAKGDAGPPSGSLEALCGEYVDAMCRFYVECFGETFRDHEQCTRELECYGVQNLKDAVEHGRIAYDASRARECFERLREEPCLPPVLGTLSNDAFGVDRLLRACPGVVEPHQTEGDECFATGECVYGHRCVETNTCPGRCERTPGWGEPCRDGNVCYHPQACLDGLCRLLASEGEPCASALDCREDLDCSPEGLCVMVARARFGQPCVRDLNGAKPARLCEDGLFCLLERNLEGTCRPLATAGERCVGDESCLPGHFCSNLALPSQPICHPLGDVGAPCNQDPWCREGLRCAGDLEPDGRFATCSLPRSLGQPCHFIGIREACADGLVCDGRRCVTALYDGDDCSAPLSRCMRGNCIDGRCRRFARLGEACELPDDCLSRSCESRRCTDRSLCSPR